MAKKRPKRRKNDKATRGNRGPRGVRGAPGARGAQGQRGLAGPPGANGEAIARLSEELANARDDLQVQFKRIAQLQAELDELRASMRKAD